VCECKQKSLLAFLPPSVFLTQPVFPSCLEFFVSFCFYYCAYMYSSSSDGVVRFLPVDDATAVWRRCVRTINMVASGV
jgi:hypothetical protein